MERFAAGAAGIAGVAARASPPSFSICSSRATCAAAALVTESPLRLVSSRTLKITHLSRGRKLDHMIQSCRMLSEVLVYLAALELHLCRDPNSFCARFGAARPSMPGRRTSLRTSARILSPISFENLAPAAVRQRRRQRRAARRREHAMRGACRRDPASQLHAVSHQPRFPRDSYR